MSQLQWLGLHTFTAKGSVQYLVRELKFHKLPRVAKTHKQNLTKEHMQMINMWKDAPQHKSLGN